MKEGLKFASTRPGALCVITTGTVMMQMLFVVRLDFFNGVNLTIAYSKAKYNSGIKLYIGFS